MREKLWNRICSCMGRKTPGTVGNIMATGLCLLAMTVVMLSYVDHVQLIQQKTDISQLARKYILRMETVGCLTPEDRTVLTAELQAVGVTEVTYEGTTDDMVGYGEPICLQIGGKLRGQYDFTEKRVSTAKN